MDNLNEMSFGQFIEAKRRECESHPSLRATATAIGVSPQFYSEVEKGRRGAFTSERLAALKTFLNLSDADAEIMYNKAAEAKKTKDVALPQDFPDYIVERDYVMSALRLAKELDAGEEEWLRFVAELQKGKE